MTFTTIGVGGFSSDAGKTTLMCELLAAFPGWEAIKVTRGHYRSCGKDPQACCVSHLLADEPVIRSGRAETYEAGKDTGRYWDAGATNVHWLVVTDRQVERGIKAALARIRSAGVFVEGTSFVQFVEVDLMFLAARVDVGKIKLSARRALPKTSGLYLFDEEGNEQKTVRARFESQHAGAVEENSIRNIPIYTREDLPRVIERVREVHRRGVAAV